MVSRALRIFGLLLLVSGTAAAHEARRPLHRAVADRSLADSGWARQLGAQRRLPPASGPRSAARPAQRRDATGRVWSHVDLSVSRRGGAAAGWTTQRFGNVSYSYSSDGTSCVSQRTAGSVLIRCQ
jgi:hypothetical protein